jgi:signal transduction histidine kinase
MMAASTSGGAAKAAADALYARFGVPVAVWVREEDVHLHRVAAWRGLPKRRVATLRRSLGEFVAWHELSDQARGVLVKRFALLSGGSAQGAGGARATILIAGTGADVRTALDVVIGLMDDGLASPDAVADLERREEDFDLALAWTSHELRSPVLATKLAIRHVLEEGNLGNSQRDTLVQSEKVLERLAGEIKHILAWESSGGAESLKRQSVVLGELVAAAVDWIVRPDEQARVVLDLQPGVEVEADECHLRRAIANLVRNALDYSPAGSQVRISLSAYRSEAVVAISNAGSLHPSERTAVFRRFARGSAGVLKPSGTGLGLFVAGRVIQAHGGRISAESNGMKTTFSVSLPTDVR